MNQYVRLSGILMLCGAIAIMTSACAKKQGAPPPRSVTVKTVQAVKIDAPIVIQTFGSTEDRMSVDIVPQVSGLLMKTLMKDGETVTNGQPLFLIDSSDYMDKVNQAEGMAKADRANLQLSRITVERNQPLLEKKLISQQDFDTFKTKSESAEAQLQMDEAALADARLNLSRCTITSPLDGICSKRFINDGNLVAAGVTKLTNIRNYDPMIVEFSVSEQYLSVIRHAQAEGKARLEIIPRGSTNIYVGTLTFVDNSVDPQGGTILLRGEVANPDLKLWAGEFVDLKLYAGVINDATMVPEGAVQFGKNGTFLYATKDGKAEMRLVKTGARFGDLIQIMDGVVAGESVVLLGQYLLYPGAPVAEAQDSPTAAGGAGALAKPGSDGK
jgi:RND family efflux transporter MFP subunit